MGDAIKIPVIASGGIMDERGIMASMMLGASAVQMGTAFLTTCCKSGVSEAYREAICNAAEDKPGSRALFQADHHEESRTEMEAQEEANQ